MHVAQGPLAAREAAEDVHGVAEEGRAVVRARRRRAARSEQLAQQRRASGREQLEEPRVVHLGRAALALQVAPAEEEEPAALLQRGDRVPGALHQLVRLWPKLELRPLWRARGRRHGERVAVAAVVVAAPRTLDLLLGGVAAIAVLLECVPHAPPLLRLAADRSLAAAGAKAANDDQLLLEERFEVGEWVGLRSLGLLGLLGLVGLRGSR